MTYNVFGGTLSLTQSISLVGGRNPGELTLPDVVYIIGLI